MSDDILPVFTNTLGIRMSWEIKCFINGQKKSYSLYLIVCSTSEEWPHGTPTKQNCYPCQPKYLIPDAKTKIKSTWIPILKKNIKEI